MRDLDQELSTGRLACDVDALAGRAEVQRPACGSLAPPAPNDAISLMSCATRHRDAERELRELVAAGATFLTHVRELQCELDRERARWAGASQPGCTARVEGAPLLEGFDAGGPRHHLRGARIHAGDGLCLLTDAGWLQGRYEWRYRPGTPPQFFFSLPGVDIQVSIGLPPGALLAWPDEIANRRQLSL